MLEGYRESIGGNRHIVMSASMGVKIGEWNALVQERFPRADFDPHQRLRLLNDEEVKTFWLHRIADGQPVDYAFSELSIKAHPTLYIIDEAHLYFDARSWKDAGPELTKYNSQHAKIGLGDVVIFITQFPDLLDKRIKGFAQEWHCCTNLGFQKVFWFFRMPQRFLVGIHYGEPARLAKPSEVSYHKIDLRVANCYDTSSGVGVVGRGAPEMKKRKTGVSWIWLIVAGGVVVWVISYGPDWFMKHVLGRIKPKREVVQVSPSLAAESGAHLMGRVSKNASPPKPTVGTLTSHEIGSAVQVASIKSVMKYGTKWRIELTDGRVFTDETGGVSAAGRDWIRLSSGEIVFRKYGVGRPDALLSKQTKYNE